MVVPTDVIDIYEHAFYVDYQNRMTDYVEKFIVIRSLAGAFRRARPAPRIIPRKRTTSRHYIYVSEIAASMSFGTSSEGATRDRRS